MDELAIPEPVQHFLAEKIDSVPQMEALLLLWEAPERAWTCADLAARIYVPAQECEALLETLRRRSLVDPQPGEPPRYRYRGEWDEGGTLMRQVASAYRSKLVAVTRLIHAKAPSSLREFARAFELKGER